MQEAALALDWGVLAHVQDDAIHEVESDVHRLTGAGIRAIERDIESEIAEKRKEITQLKRMVEALTKLAAEEADVFPKELTYRYTLMQGKDVYVTKEKELLVEDAGSAEAAARRIEKGIDRFGRLRDQMIEMLKQRRKTVQEASEEVDSFVQATDGLVTEVLATIR